MSVLQKVGEPLYFMRNNSVCIFLVAAVCLFASGCATSPDAKPAKQPRPANAAQPASSFHRHAALTTAPSSSPSLASAVTQSASRPRQRTDDPVVMQGKAFPSLLGLPPERLGLLRCDAGTLVPVPMQIDERKPDGSFAFTHGPKASADPEPGFDANDELVFVARDTGERCLNAPLPQGVSSGVEIEVRDPVLGSSSWLYLFAFTTTAPASTRDYVKAVFDRPEGDWRIEADSFIVEFAKNALYYNYISLKLADGSWTPNLVDRLKIRGSFSVFFDTLQFEFQAEELSKTQLFAWIDGPVRVLFHLTGHFEALIKIPIKADLLVQVYPSYFILPLHLDIPVDLSSILSKASLHGINDFSQNIYRYNVRYYDAHNPLQSNVVIDGVLSEEEWLLNYNDERDWVALVGDGVGAMNRIFFPPEANYISKRLYVGENPTHADPPEAEPGIVALGYDFDGIINIKKGAYTFFLHFYFPPGFKAGDEARVLNITDNPLQPVSRPLRKK